MSQSITSVEFRVRNKISAVEPVAAVIVLRLAVTHFAHVEGLRRKASSPFPCVSIVVFVFSVAGLAGAESADLEIPLLGVQISSPFPVSAVLVFVLSVASFRLLEEEGSL